MLKKNVVHIHTDTKFIDESRKFEGELFENIIVIITNSKSYNGYYKDSAIRLSTSILDFLKIIRLCKMVDLVVLYNLDSIKQRITLVLPKNIKIIWRFFGYELHSLNRTYSYTKITKQIVNKEDKTTRPGKISIRKILSYLKWRMVAKNNFDLTLERIDFFLAWSEEEYTFLKRYEKKLPFFIKLPLELNFVEKVEECLSKKATTIIIGNNRSSTNNHIDILNIVVNSRRKDFLAILPFNYGNETSYSNKVKDMGSSLPNILFLNEFMPLEQYYKIFQEASALVINTLHQGALGNIFIAIKNHTKVYLNRVNPVYNWLKNIGINVYTIEEFQIDIEQNRLKLHDNDAYNNIVACKKVIKNYSIENFQLKIYELL